MTIQYDVVATIGTYQTQQGIKYINRKVGVVLDTQNGPALKMDSTFNPAGCKKDEGGAVWLKLFVPKPKNQNNAQPQQQGQQQQPPAQHNQYNNDDDIPW